MRGVLLAMLVACGGKSPPPTTTQQAAPAPRAPTPLELEALERPPTPPILNIDWSATKVDSTADALALWARIAPNGADWEAQLAEIPDRFERQLAIALIEGGNFACMPPPSQADCAPKFFDVKDPAHSAGLGDPCLRRLLALWAVDKLEPADLPTLRTQLRAIVAIPPPESELVAAVLAAIPEDDHALRLDLLATAWNAGQHDVVNSAVGRLDEPNLIVAATKHHIDSALEILSAEGHRAAYLAAVTDERMPTKGRTRAMFDLVAADAKLAPDVRAALVKAAASQDCTVAATAARLLEHAGDKRFVPKRPRARSSDRMMRALCVLASYEAQQRADEPSLLAGYVPQKGLERMTITYDPLGDSDPDGDGNPHTTRSIDLIAKTELVLPELDDLIAAFRNCTGTTCRSNDREWRFTFAATGGELLLTRLEIAERPPCPKP